MIIDSVCLMTSAVGLCVGAAVSTMEIDNVDSLLNRLSGRCRGRVRRCCRSTMGSTIRIRC